jgi:hypothetical protein
MLAVAVAAVGAGAFGPIYLHSADQSVLDGVLASAPSGTTGITVEQATGTHTSVARLRAVARQVPQPTTGRPWFGPPIETDQAGVTTVAGNQPYGSELVSRTGVCRHLAIVSGHCASRPGTVTLSTRSARELGLRAGQRITLSFDHSSRHATLTVAGLFRPGSPQAPYWFGANYFGFGTASPSKPRLDDMFASVATVRRTAPPDYYSRILQLPYRQGSLGTNDIGSLVTALRHYEAESLRDHNTSVGTQLTRLLGQVTSTQHTVTTIVVVMDLELTVLALFALYFVSTRTAAERAPDLRLADLRGFRPRSSLGVALAEPVAVIVVAVPAGLLVAWLVASAVAPHVFLPGIGASLTLLAVVAAVVTGIVGVAATALGARQLVAEAGAGTASAAGSRGHTTWRIVGDVAVVAVAAAAFVELALSGVARGSTGTSADPLAALAPGLLALGVGVLAARLLPVLVRSTLRFTADSRRVATALATRRVARSTEFAPQIVLTVVAVGLGTFGVSGWAVASANRASRSEFDVGASKVLLVSVRPGVNFLAATRRADGGSGSAMAVVVEQASDGTTLAVDSRHLASVASWPPGLSPGGATVAARRLIPPGLAPSVTVSGDQLAVTADSRFTARPAPELSVDLFDEGYQTSQQVVLGPLRPGPATYVGSIQGLCPSGCRLVDLAVSWSPPSSAAASTQTRVDMVVTRLARRRAAGPWTPLPAGLDDAARWHSPSGGARVTASPAGLHARLVVSGDGASTTVAPADTPARLPVIPTTLDSGVSVGAGATVTLVGLDGGTITGRQVDVVPALPGVGASGALVDLGLAERFQSGPMIDVVPQVWLSASAPSTIGSRLAAQGVSVLRVESAASRDAVLARGGVGFAYSLFLLAAVAAAVLAVGATAFALAVGARRRGAELAAMRAVRVTPRSLRRSVEGEQALVLGAGVVLGAAAGMAAAAVALGSIPEFVSSGAGPPLALGLPAGALAVFLGVLAVALGLAVAAGAGVMVRAATVDKLGGAER